MTHPTGDFTTQADAYQRARPGYPEALLDQLIAHLGVRAGDPVVEIGAGTGLFTKMLAARHFRITALEPNAAMRERMPPLANVRVTAGTFEATGLPDGSQRWAVAAQAFHWADADRALPELARVLVPGGAVTVLWNVREHEGDAVVQWTREAIRRHVPDFTHAYRDTDWAAVLTRTGHFADVHIHAVPHTVRMDAARYLALWQSHHRLTTIAGPQRMAAFLTELTDHLQTQNITTINVPYTTRAWTAHRKQ